MRQTLKTILVIVAQRRTGSMTVVTDGRSAQNEHCRSVYTQLWERETIIQSELTDLTECGTFASTTESSETINVPVGDSVKV